MNYGNRHRILAAFLSFFLLAILLSVCFSSCGPNYLSVTGGLEDRSGSHVTTIILRDNQAYSLELDRIGSKERSAFYLLGKKIYAKLGISRVGLIEKDLSRITEIPFHEEDYKRDGITPELNCVYALRYGNPQDPLIALLRIENIARTSIRILCYKVPHE